MTDELPRLIAERDALNEKIKLIERGIQKAAYDGYTRQQLLTINEDRIKSGKRQLSMGEFCSGLIFDEEEPRP